MYKKGNKTVVVYMAQLHMVRAQSWKNVEIKYCANKNCLRTILQERMGKYVYMAEMV